MCLALPGRILTIEDRADILMAEVDFSGARKEICLSYVPDAQVGDYVLVHVGFAIQRLDEQTALETLAMFREMGMLNDELEALDPKP